LLCGLLETDGEVKLGFNGDLYPSGGASVVMTTSGDMVKYESGARARLAIGSANQLLQVKSSLPSWETVDLADTVLTTAGDVLYENNTPELARLPKGSDDDILTLASGLPSWAAAAGGGLWSVIGNYEAASAEATTTLSFDAVDFDDDSFLYLVLDGAASAATTTLELRFDDDSTANYHGTFRRQKDSSETMGSFSGQDSAEIGSANLFNAASHGFTGFAHISMNKAGTMDNVSCISQLYGDNLNTIEWDWFQLDVVKSDISSLVILAAANWMIGTRFTLYKVARA